MSETLAQFTAQQAADITTLQLVGFDLQKPAGTRYRSIGAAAMLAAWIAAFEASLTGQGGTFTNHALGISVPVGGYVDTQLYAPSKNTNDINMVNLSFGQASIVPQPFHFQVYVGAPSSGNATLLYDSALAMGGNIKTSTTQVACSVYVAAAAGANVLWLRTFNAGSIALAYSFQGTFLEFPGNGIVLPAYQYPPFYTGPLLSTVHVGPNEQFVEPQFGLQALADGGTMFLDDGHYYLPMCVSSTADSDQTPQTNAYYRNFGYNGVNPVNRFTNVTIKGNSTYGVTWDGLGGVGNGFRLAEGKGILLMHVPGLVKTMNFISGGGANTSEFGGGGEAGLYVEGFVNPGTLTVENCAFDNCGDGIFTADVDDTNSQGVLTQNIGAGVNVSVVLNACDFGYNAPNGINGPGVDSNGSAISAGGSHNFYNNCASITVNGCHMYSCLYGNTMKCRGPAITVSGSYVEGGQGRALDNPEGGSVTVTNSIFSVIAGANQPFLSYNAENGPVPKRSWRAFSNPTFDGCTLIGTRGATAGSQIWMNLSSGNFVFTNTTQQWFPYGGTPGFLPQRTQSAFEADDTAVSGLFLTPAGGGTVLTAPPVRPGSIAQPGHAVTSFTAWNGTV